ncbi:alpha/beta hydrolase family protein [Pseudoxanthomonas dokdonensis]|uniref:Serine aminopeptidase S33 domain-containing protein n=1 Tax=Pseudoxanthomonas dokdonensis TaxID=344882 RepID=A0A0R0CHL3_9GAMM|nr:alpha/beta fold hydrolase [Pseudoxanthomonas dokdonensis]KRG68944.1 hypothetical protein ABB29_10800 [Pseudoxanthomonas dokdonensis]
MPANASEFALQTSDGHRYTLLARLPAQPSRCLLWIPALGVAARHYLPLAEQLADRGVAVFLHEWRGNGSSNLRAGAGQDWGYRQLLLQDIACSHATLRQHSAGVPGIIGGHSLGGQLAACYLGLQPQAFAQLWLVASGSPYWRGFPGLRGHLLPLFYQFAIWIARRRGSFPGRRLGFGGEEAQTLIRDWASVGLSGRYAAAGVAADLEQALAGVTAEHRAVVLADDWLGPLSSLRNLLGKMPQSAGTVACLSSQQPDFRADHFQWMKQPGGVIDLLL